jgi:ADP-ribose pyrophosphatase YjhB (NUDIX family)
MGIVKRLGFSLYVEWWIINLSPTNHARFFWSIPKGKVDKDETMLDAASLKLMRKPILS